jgi:hypothetical protein
MALASGSVDVDLTLDDSEAESTGPAVANDKGDTYGEFGYICDGSLTGVIHGGADVDAVAKENFVAPIIPSSSVSIADPTFLIWGSDTTCTYNFE